MKTTLRWRSFNIFKLACVFSVLVVGINLAITFLVTDTEQKSVLSDLISPILDVLTLTALFIAAKQSAAHSKHLVTGWGTIALAVLFSTLGDITWAILEVGLKQEPFPSLADGFYLISFPIFLAGVLFLADNPASTGERINRGIDIGIILTAAILAYWNFLIGPSIVSNYGLPYFEQLILLAYPVGDLVLFGALLLIINIRSIGRTNFSLLLVGASLLATIITDSLFDYQTLLGTYVSGGLLDIGWILSTLLLGLAGINQITSLKLKHNPGKFRAELELSEPWKVILESVS